MLEVYGDYLFERREFQQAALGEFLCGPVSSQLFTSIFSFCACLAYPKSHGSIREGTSLAGAVRHCHTGGHHG